MIGQLSKLASSGQRFATQGVSGALIASATRGRTVETVADLGGLSVSTLAERVGTGMFTAIDFAISQFATDTAVRADVTRIVRRDLDDRALERQLVRDVAWRSAARGAVSGIPAVIPAAGTVIELSAAVADSLAMTVTEARMVLALAHLRGLDVQETELRRLDIMIVLGMAAGAAEIDGDIIRIGSEELSIDVLRSWHDATRDCGCARDGNRCRCRAQGCAASHERHPDSPLAGWHFDRCCGVVRLASDTECGQAGCRVLRSGCTHATASCFCAFLARHVQP